MKRTVALVASTTSEDGAEMLAARLRHLLDRGWDAWLFCKGERWRDAPALCQPDLHDRIELALDASAGSSPFDGRLRSLRPQLVHFHSGHAAEKGLRNGQLRGSKIAISLQTNGSDLHVGDLDLLWERADVLFFADRVALQRALDLGCPERRTVIVERPVQVPGPDHRRNLGNGSLRVLSAGPLVWEQGFEHSIQAIRLLLDEGVPCEYRIIGDVDGDHAPAVAFARHQLGLYDHVHLLPEDGLGQLPRELRSADVFVDPAVADTISSAPLGTAQAHGVPFVATARHAPVVDDAGIQVPRRDARAIAAALSRLAADPDMRERMGRRAERLSDAWLIEDHLAELERLYRAALAG
jgi:glycosyltransferase involved in cell wall biosynthesis